MAKSNKYNIRPRRRPGFRFQGFVRSELDCIALHCNSGVRNNYTGLRKHLRSSSKVSWRSRSSYSFIEKQKIPTIMDTNFLVFPGECGGELVQPQPPLMGVLPFSTITLPAVEPFTVVLPPHLSLSSSQHLIVHEFPNVVVVSNYWDSMSALQLAQNDYSVGNYECSRQRCIDILLKKPDNYDALVLLSSIYIQTGNIDDAMRCCGQAIQIQPSMSAAFVNLGVAFQAKNQLEDAGRCYRHALHLNPSVTEAYIGCGNVALFKGQIVEAMSAFFAALVYDPNLYLVQNELGNLYNSIGNIDEAETCWKEAIKIKPDFALAYYNLGCSYASTEDFEIATHYLQEAVNLDPQFCDASLKLAGVFVQQKMSQKAVDVYARLLQAPLSKSEKIYVYTSVGAIYYDMKLYDHSISMYTNAIQVCLKTETGESANLANLFCDLGNCYKAKDLMKEAEKCYLHALELVSEHPHSMNNLGSLRQQEGCLEEAEAWYRKSLTIKPDFTTAMLNLSLIFHISGRLDSALTTLYDALTIDPNCTDVYFNIGNVLRDKNETDAAIEYFNKTIELKPDHVGCLSSLALLLKENGLYKEAMDLFYKALRYIPELPEAYYNLVHCKQICCDWNGLEEHKLRIIQIVEEQLSKNQLPCVHPHHTMLFPFSHCQRKLIAKRYCEEFSMRGGIRNYFHSTAQPYFTHSNILKHGERLKIGYVSFDFKNHPTSHLMQSIPGHHRQSLNTEVYCYALNPDDGTFFRSKIAATAEHFVDLSTLTFRDAANKIFSDGIHILVDLNGYTRGAKTEIFALKPAPIQVMWLGYPGSSGSSYMDYIITDEVTSPLEFASHYSEKFAYMPHTYFIGDHESMFPHLKHRIILPSIQRIEGDTLSDTVTVLNVPDHLKGSIKKVHDMDEKYKVEEGQESGPTDGSVYIVEDREIQNEVVDMIRSGIKERIIAGIKYQVGKYNPLEATEVAYGEKIPCSIVVTSRSQYSLPEKAIVYCNFNQLYKFNYSTFESWVNILKRVPNGVLWLLRFPPQGEQNLRSLSLNMGLDPERIIFSDVALKEEHVRRGQLADICLDTPLCNGHTTSMDILWTGTPIVTLPGETLASRVTSSQLSCLGVTELIATTKKDYEDIAVRLGTDFEYLKFIRAKVVRRRSESTLFNTATFASNLERLYWRMWRRYKDGEEVDHITELSTHVRDKKPGF
ncbi:unnamed protein product [Orchesella dallaii]|uniref:protein O-GlcNAc transferase n=1 Tax=Orchesella dallaii TaxID=48710 RepID=A0ABP1Q585_9HEXA